MVKVEIGNPIGFCFGVRRALRLALIAKREHKHLFSWGELIHNPHINERLAKIGIKSILNLEELAPNSALILRAHGVKQKIIKAVKEKNIEIIDTTCPKVKYLQNIAYSLHKKKYYVVIVGDEEHPEIEVIKDNLKTNYMVVGDTNFVLSSPMSKVGLLAQTTQREDLFYQVASTLLSLRVPQLVVHNTICSEVLQRQDNCRYLAKNNQAVLIIGGKNSANTRRLYLIAKNECAHVYHIESKEELNLKEISSFKSIGVTGGTSTPLWVIREVINILN